MSIDAFEQAMYWVSLAREYAPPGLLPREAPGPKRARRAGSTIHFVKQAVYPQFLLQNANVSVSLGDEAGAGRGDYRLAASDVTTEPAIVGRPTRFSFDRSAKGSAVESFGVNASIDHLSATPRELVELRADGMSLPGFALPVDAAPRRAGTRAQLDPARHEGRRDFRDVDAGGSERRVGDGFDTQRAR